MAYNPYRYTIKRFLSILSIFLFLLFITLILSLSIGPAHIPPIKVFLNIIGIDSDYTVIVRLRIARTLASLLTGSLLGLSGLLMQAITRNPLADPYILGLSSTALAVVALGITVNPSIMVNKTIFMVIAFVGAMLGYALTLCLSRLAGGGALALVLSGIAVASIFSGISHVLLYIVQSRLNAPYYFLLLGSASIALYREIPYLIAPLAIGALVSLLMFRPLNLYIYGDSYVKQYGYSPLAISIIATVIASLLTASTIAVVGIVGFIGLAAPHIARFLTGSDHRFSIPITIVVGGILTLVSDICVRLISMYVGALGELPLGVITSVVGGPFLAYLVIRRVRQ